MKIQWYPGHMTKARRKIEEDVKLVDVLVELLDARIPFSSRNPDIDRIAKDKKRIVVLNKSDLADESKTKKWTAFFEEKGIKVVLTNSTNGKGLKDVEKAALKLMEEKLAKLREKGLLTKTVRIMILGIPNVGKSTFINKIAGKAIAETGDRPGVTRSRQWVKVSSQLELLDTPGILWPKFEDEMVGYHLAFTGAIKDDIIDKITLAGELLLLLAKKYPDRVMDRYKLSKDDLGLNLEEILELVGKKRGFLMSGGRIDLDRTATIILDEYRGGKMGKISLEEPEDFNRVDIQEEHIKDEDIKNESIKDESIIDKEETSHDDEICHDTEVCGTEEAQI